jgi:hypothetical protein
MFLYDRAAAVAYAEKWAFARNPQYYDFSALGGDCTNFVSQCLFAGGMPMNHAPLGWYYTSPKSRSASFSGVQFLYNFLTRANNRRGPVARVVQTVDELQIGDIVQLTFNGVQFTHSLLVVGFAPDTVQAHFPRTGPVAMAPRVPLLATHSYDAYARPLTSYTYVRARFLQVLGANG